MKQLIAILSLVISAQAFAIALPGWNRPVESAQLDVQSAIGQFAAVKRGQAVLTKLDGQTAPSQVKLVLNGIQRRYQIVESTVSEDGIRMITAVDPAQLTSSSPLPEATFVTIIDYRAQINVPSEKWEVRVETVTADDVVVGELVLTGKPEPVFTIQIEQTL
ncbi:MAG: hypothetical protein IT288_14315 [Bdellovibrionales bacterium]|nr:hypothetical protein [Bdellovibrionales bacterium]